MIPTGTTGDKNSYAEVAQQSRIKVLDLIYKAQTSHIGSNFSCADILTVLYDVADLSLIDGGITKDIIMVKSWAAASVYACLVKKGLLPQEAIDNYGERKWTTILEPITLEHKCEECNGTGHMD